MVKKNSPFLCYCSIVTKKKLIVARIFAAKFRRHLSLNHAAQTATAVLNMPEYLSAMRKDWEQLDFDGLLDQTLWVCDCNTTDIRHICKLTSYYCIH